MRESIHQSWSQTLPNTKHKPSQHEQLTKLFVEPNPNVCYNVREQRCSQNFVWLSIIRISGLTDLKPCRLPTYMYNAQFSLSDNTGFRHFWRQLILLPYKTFHPQKCVTFLIFNTMVAIGKGSIHLHNPSTQLI